MRKRYQVNADRFTDCTVDVLAKLLPECHAQTECAVTISDEHFGNPCAIGVNKYLNLIFMCGKPYRRG